MSLVFDFFHSSSSSSEEEEEIEVSEKGHMMFLEALSLDERKRSSDRNCVVSSARQTHTDGFKGICKIGDRICAVQSHPKVGYGIVMLDKNELIKSKRILASECASDTSLDHMKREKREPKGLVVINDSVTYFTCMKKGSKVHTLHCMIREEGKTKRTTTVPWPEKYAQAKSSPRYLCFHEKSGYVYAICGNGMIFRTRVKSKSIEYFGRTGHGGARNLCFGLGTSTNFLIVTGKNYVAVFDTLHAKSTKNKPIYFQYFQKVSRDRSLFRSKPFQNDFWFEKAGTKFRKVCMIDGTMIVLHSYGICVVQHDFIESHNNNSYEFRKVNRAEHRIFANLSGQDPHDFVPIHINRDEGTATLAVTVTGKNEIHVIDVDLFVVDDDDDDGSSSV